MIVPLAAAALFATPLAAQDVTCVEAGDKNPTTARVVGILPGAGHIYACEFLRGLVYYVGTLGIVGIGAASAAVDCLNFSSSDGCGRSADVAFVAAAGLWAWSIYDAGRAARRTNAKRRSRVSLMLRPSLPLFLPQPRAPTPDARASHARYTRPRLLVGVRVVARSTEPASARH